MAPAGLVPLAQIDAHNAVTRGRIAAPQKRIHSDDDMRTWATSTAHDAIVLFVMHLGDAAVAQPTRAIAWDSAAHAARAASTDTTDRILAMLQEIDAWTDEIEPQSGAHRFGNLAFRTWGARFTERITALHHAVLPQDLQAWITELAPYLAEAFGSFVRIDYGTGHELNFVAWLGLLYRLGVLGSGTPTYARLALEVFPAYLRVVWHLQDRYSLEPAGSHGVWGLDDYQFVPYILGAAQLREATSITPLGMTDLALYPFVRQQGPRSGPRITPEETLLYEPPQPLLGVPVPNMFTTSLARVHSLKRGPFSEHSPLLYDIAQNVPTWYKVYLGMLKMYDAECLLKRPVVQHFVFGGVGYAWEGSDAPPGPASAVPARPRALCPTALPHAPVVAPSVRATQPNRIGALRSPARMSTQGDSSGPPSAQQRRRGSPISGRMHLPEP